MLVPWMKDTQMRWGVLTFFAKPHKGDTCGSNGLPLTPNSITICGKAQILKSIKHPHLCQYLDIIRGKHERTVVISQYCGKQLFDFIGKEAFEVDYVKRFAYQMLKGLKELHDRNIVHRNLSNENVLLQDDGNIKLFNYGLYYMTGCGQLVSFPILQVTYVAPEVYLNGCNSYLSDPKVDIWSLGIVLVELILNKVLWKSLNLGQKIRKVLSLLHCETSIFERIAREHNSYEIYQNVPSELKEFIDMCLNVYPKNRPTCDQLLSMEIFQSFNEQKKTGKSNGISEPFEIFTINELYHWWQLAIGDIFKELNRQGFIRSIPPILSLPSLVLLDETILGQDRNPTTLYDSRVYEMPLNILIERFQHLDFNAYYPLLHCKSNIIKETNSSNYDVTSLPLVIRERDPEYQFHRVILFRRLLYGSPSTRMMIIKEAHSDIPPLLRGDTWAVLLDIKGDYTREYAKIDKETPTSTDRQIEVDIPRCHQYNELLSSSEGHRKLKRILKAWIKKNNQYVYWQGLDSLTAPFLYLNFNDEAKAFVCLSTFIPKYLHNFFLKDNSMIIQEYLAKFSQIIAFHDAELANHLYNINFYPELYAIPWFLTIFSHVFPLDKILHLWDKLLLRDSSFPLHIGLSVLTQLRDKLLSSGFNECILLFSDLPEVDIEKCVNLSVKTYDSTPKSITRRQHENENYGLPKTELDITNITLAELKQERCPRISATDTVNLIRKSPKHIILIDIRNPTQFNRCSVIGSINIPFTNVSFGGNNIDSIGNYSSILKNNKNKVIIVIGTEDTDLEQFPKFLLNCGVGKVCVLHGGFNILLTVTPTVLTTQIQN